MAHAMASELPPWPHAAAVTETRVSIHGEETIYARRRPREDPCFVRLHGDLILSHGSHSAVREFDRRVRVDDIADFKNIEVCSKLIHGVLADAPAISDFSDLAADSWVDPTFTPRSIATDIDRYVREKFDDTMGVPVPSLEFDIHLSEIRVTLAYSQPKALLLACKTEAARALARRRGEPDDGELCAICLLDVETIEQEETVRLPCSHPFHHGCISPWFHRASTCPTCRRDIRECSSYVRSVPPEEFMHVQVENEDEVAEEDEHHVY